jgi:hypothetical protein
MLCSRMDSQVSFTGLQQPPALYRNEDKLLVPVIALFYQVLLLPIYYIYFQLATELYNR